MGWIDVVSFSCTSWQAGPCQTLGFSISPECFVALDAGTFDSVARFLLSLLLVACLSHLVCALLWVPRTDVS